MQIWSEGRLGRTWRGWTGVGEESGTVLESQMINTVEGLMRTIRFGNVEVVDDLDKNSFGAVGSRENRRGIEDSEYR